MNLKQLSVLLLGSWNTKIFTPGWILENVFPSAQSEEIEGMVFFEELEFGFQFKEVIIIPRPNAIEIRLDFTNKSFEINQGDLVETTLMRILNLLPHTPIKALGVNFNLECDYKYSNGYIDYLKTFPAEYKSFLTKQVKQTVNYEKYQFNLVSDFLTDKIQLNCNFHYGKVSELGTNFIKEHYKEVQSLLNDGE